MVDLIAELIPTSTKHTVESKPVSWRRNGASNQWLREELARFRHSNKRPAPVLLEPGPARIGFSYALNTSELAGYLRCTRILIILSDYKVARDRSYAFGLARN